MFFYAARQPVLDINKQLVGYELLFRDGVDNIFPNIDGDEATSRLIEGSQFNYGFDDLTDGKPAYINFTLETLLKGYPTMLTPEQLIVEVLETVQPGKRLLSAVKELKEQGYTIVLDDYQHQAVWRHFYPFIDQIKVDMLVTSPSEIEVIIKAISPFPHIQLVAEKVENHEVFEQAKKMGFSFFQGFFFAQPEMVQTKALPPSEMALAELLYETSSVDVDLARVTQVFERDVNLSYKLLRYANSAAFRRKAEISTIKQALIVLGNEELKKFLSLLFAAQVSSEKPVELIKLSMTRAHFMELVAKHTGELLDTGMAFLTGMMSLMDAILDEEMDSVMKKLPLSIEIKRALLEQQGVLHQYLTLSKLHEHAKWDDEKALCSTLNIDPLEVAQCYQDALVWCDQQLQVMSM